MKQRHLLLLLSALLFACSENLDVKKVAQQAETRSLQVDRPYMFDGVSNLAIWRSFTSLEDRQQACQVPEELLKSMSTADLVETCMRYPLAGLYMAYNNELYGLQVIMDGFNGFQELKKREDAAEKLLDYYEKIDIDEIVRTEPTWEAIRTGKTAMHIGYVELILSSEFIPSLYDDKHIERMKKAMDEKYESKLKHTDKLSMFTVGKSLLLGARTKLKAKNSDLSDEEKTLLTRFVRHGGMAESGEEYTNVSRIINK